LPAIIQASTTDRIDIRVRDRFNTVLKVPGSVQDLVI